MEVNTSTSSKSASQSHILSPCTTLGNHSGFGQQLYETISHGKKTPFERNWRTGMLLHSTSCQQPWRTPAIFCYQCYRQGLEVLNESAGLLLFEHRGFLLRIGHEIYSNFSLPTSIRPSSTIPHSKPRLQESSLPNFPPSWTASATTKKQQHAGLMMNRLFVPVLHYDNIHPNLTQQINTSSSTEMRFTSPNRPSHRSLQALYRTRSRGW